MKAIESRESAKTKLFNLNDDTGAEVKAVIPSIKGEKWVVETITWEADGSLGDGNIKVTDKTSGKVLYEVSVTTGHNAVGFIRFKDGGLECPADAEAEVKLTGSSANKRLVVSYV